MMKLGRVRVGRFRAAAAMPPPHLLVQSVCAAFQRTRSGALKPNTNLYYCKSVQGVRVVVLCTTNTTRAAAMYDTVHQGVEAEAVRPGE